MHRREDGQALVETALVVPLFLFTFLVLLQFMLIAHARVLVDYAAFNAARAGVVHNGNKQAMRSAAFLSVLPVFGPTDTVDNYIKTYAKFTIAQGVGSAVGAITTTVSEVLGRTTGVTLNLPGAEIVEVVTLNPAVGDFKGDEIDFDLAQRTDEPDTEAIHKNRLSIRVRALVPLNIPLANRMLFYGFVAAMYFSIGDKMQELKGSHPTLGILEARMKNEKGNAGVLAKDFVNQNLVPLGLTGDVLNVIDDIATYNVLRFLSGLDKPVYAIPVYAYYTMPMESNFYKGNLF